MAADWATCLYCQSPSGPQRLRNTTLIASSALKMPLLIKSENKNHFGDGSKARASNPLMCGWEWNAVDWIWWVVWGEVPIMPRGQRRPFRMLRLASLAARWGHQQKVAWPRGPPLTEPVRTATGRRDVLFVSALPWRPVGNGWMGRGRKIGTMEMRDWHKGRGVREGI